MERQEQKLEGNFTLHAEAHSFVIGCMQLDNIDARNAGAPSGLQVHSRDLPQCWLWRDFKKGWNGRALVMLQVYSSSL